MAKTKVLAKYQESKRKQDAADLGLLVYALIYWRIVFLIEWYQKVNKKRRGYPHFDLNITPKTTVSLITSPEEISIHQFYPLIRFQKEERKYIKSKIKGTSPEIEIKSRDIYYASHKDSLIYSWYSTILEFFYEKTIADKPFKNSVIAYRKLGNKSNIDFAHEVFEYIKSRKSCVAITIDIKHFFDSLDHGLVKKSWREILGLDFLPKDHYKIYRSITKYAYVDREKLYEEFNVKGKNHTQRICSIEDFRKIVRGKSLICKNQLKIGIPQGTPISSCVSNIYMMNFDKSVYRYTSNAKAFYRRYSDDIVIVCSLSYKNKIMSMLKRNLKRVNLETNSKKTSVIYFKRDRGNNLNAYSEKGTLANLQYLGFHFNGENYYIRPSSLSRYYNKMKKAVRRSSQKAYKNKNNKKIFGKKIYKMFTHLGKRNFISYAQLASKKMDSNSIRMQIKAHMKKIIVAINKHSTH